MGLGIGPLELILVFVVALLVFGPHRLPQFMNTVGKAVGDFRRAVGQVSADLTADTMPRAARRDRTQDEPDESPRTIAPPRDLPPPPPPSS